MNAASIRPSAEAGRSGVMPGTGVRVGSVSFAALAAGLVGAAATVAGAVVGAEAAGAVGAPAGAGAVVGWGAGGAAVAEAGALAPDGPQASSSARAPTVTPAVANRRNPRRSTRSLRCMRPSNNGQCTVDSR